MWGITLAGSFLFALTLCEKPVKTVKETRRNGNTRFPACCGQHMRAAMRGVSGGERRRRQTEEKLRKRQTVEHCANGKRRRTVQAANGGEAAQVRAVCATRNVPNDGWQRVLRTLCKKEKSSRSECTRTRRKVRIVTEGFSMRCGGRGQLTVWLFSENSFSIASRAA